MTTKPPGDRQHLERLLNTWSGATKNVTAGRLRNVVGVTVIAQMLDGLRDDEDTHLFVFKGGAGLQMRYGLQTRATKDLDAAFRAEMETVVKRVTSAVESGWSGFTGVVTNAEPITRANLTPRPMRMKVKLFYKGRGFITIPFEVSPAEATSIDIPEMVPVAIDLEPVRLEGPTALPFLPLRYQIAQKIHACSEPSTDAYPYDRVRDLVDLDLIEELSVRDEHLPDIKAACVEIFESRAMHAWPPRMRSGPGWNQLWDRLSEDERLEMTLDEALASANAFVARIDSA
jgi:hypothetical protein